MRRYSYNITRTLEEYVEVALKKGWIRLFKSLAASNILIAKKKDDLKRQPYSDFRELNNATIRD